MRPPIRRPVPIRAGLAGLVLAGAALAPSCGDAAAPSATGRPRHVLLLVVDTLRADHLSAYGYGRPTSPNLDALAADGVRFETAISQASWTWPSMVSLLTSDYVAEEAMHIPAGHTTIAEVFQKGGWSTAGFVYNDILKPKHGFARGFEVFDWQSPPYGSDELLEAWVTGHASERSFTWVHLNEAHDAYGAHDDKFPAGAPTPFRAAEGSLDEDRQRFYDQLERRGDLDAGPEVRARLADLIGSYDDDVLWSDARIGRIFDIYRDADIWDDTLVVIASDHGECLWTREEWMTGKRLKAINEGRAPDLHNSLLDSHGAQAHMELVRTPLILRGPGVPAGRVVDTVVENVDIAPTLFELCDLPPASTMVGESLVELARGEAPAKRDGGFSFTRYVTTLVDDDGWQLIQPTSRGECDFGLVPELFDLRSDPRARRNLAAREPTRLKRMQLEIRKRVDAGITGSNPELTADDMASLNSLGYVEAGVIDRMDAEFLSASDEVLVGIVRSYENCVRRLQAAKALRARAASLAPELRALLEQQLRTEVSDAVRAELEAIGEQ